MRVDLYSRGLFVVFRYATKTRPALGFVIKPVSQMIFSERHQRYRSLTVGRFYMRTFAKASSL